MFRKLEIVKKQLKANKLHSRIAVEEVEREDRCCELVISFLLGKERGCLTKKSKKTLGQRIQ